MIVGLYMDVHVPMTITEGLRRRGVDVLTSQEDGTRRATDEQAIAALYPASSRAFHARRRFLETCPEVAIVQQIFLGNCVCQPNGDEHWSDH